jgi:basic membrane protein A
MDGFYAARLLQCAKGHFGKVLGWDPKAKKGLFTNNFDSLDDGRAFAQNLYDEGADIVLPVAGPVGLGSARWPELGTDALKIIGVDADSTSPTPSARPCLPDLDHQAHGRHRVQRHQERHGRQVRRRRALSARWPMAAWISRPSTSMEERGAGGVEAELEAIRAGIIDGSIDRA